MSRRRGHPSISDGRRLMLKVSRSAGGGMANSAEAGNVSLERIRKAEGSQQAGEFYQRIVNL
jgi:hypothetical protein